MKSNFTFAKKGMTCHHIDARKCIQKEKIKITYNNMKYNDNQCAMHAINYKTHY